MSKELLILIRPTLELILLRDLFSQHIKERNRQLESLDPVLIRISCKVIPSPKDNPQNFISGDTHGVELFAGDFVLLFDFKTGHPLVSIAVDEHAHDAVGVTGEELAFVGEADPLEEAFGGEGEVDFIQSFEEI